MKKIIIIGGDAAGMSALSQAKREYDDLEIKVYEKGDYISYSACGMPYFIEDKIKEKDALIVYTPEEAKEKWNSEIKINNEVLSIDHQNKTITVKNLNTNEIFEDNYDKLIIAVGTKSRKLVIEGSELKNIFYIKTLNDAVRIKDFVDKNKPRNVLIVGSGYIGMEMAYTFFQKGMKVTVAEMADKVCNLEQNFAGPIIADLEEKGINFFFNSKVEKFSGDKNGNVNSAVINGKEYHFSMVLISIGIEPNLELISNTNIKPGKTGNIKVDEYMRTSNENIYAAGDCIEIKHLITNKPVYIPLALLANRSGRIAGHTAVNDLLDKKPSQNLEGILGTVCVKIGDWEIASTGLFETQAKENNFDFFCVTDQVSSKAGYYPGAAKINMKIIVENKTGKVLGVQMIGKDGVVHRINTFVAALTAGMTVENIYNLDTAYAPPFSPVYDPVINICGKAMLKLKKDTL